MTVTVADAPGSTVIVLTARDPRPFARSLRRLERRGGHVVVVACGRSAVPGRLGDVGDVVAATDDAQHLAGVAVTAIVSAATVTARLFVRRDRADLRSGP